MALICLRKKKEREGEEERKRERSLSIGACFIWQDFLFATSGTNIVWQLWQYCSLLNFCHVEMTRLHTFSAIKTFEFPFP